MKRNVGRPSIDTAFRIRTKAWFIAVSQASGMNAEELEIYFAPPDKQGMYRGGNRPRLWEKYRAGRICPKSKPDRNEKESIVERVGKCFPGTDKWISMPFWQVLSYSQMEMHELKAVYRSLSNPVRELIIMEKAQENKMFWRTPTNQDDLYRKLISIGDIDAATAVLAMIKEAEVTQNQFQHRQGLAWWAYCVWVLQNHPVLSQVMDDINKIIADRFTRVGYPDEHGVYQAMTKSEVRSILTQYGS